MRNLLFRLLALVPLCACTSAPTVQIPDPLPEALEWARPTSGGAFLGLKTQENDGGSLDALFFDPGVRVSRVIENSPAAAAGFLVGDVVLTIDGHEVNDPGALDALVDELGAGNDVPLEVRRDDTAFEVNVLLQAAGDPGAEAKLLYRLDPSRSRAGWVTARGGAMLVSSAQDAPMTNAGLSVGSLVTAVEDREVHSARALIRELERQEPGATVTLAVRDEAGDRDVQVQLQDAPRRLTGVGFPVLFSYAADAEGRETSFVLIDLYFISLFRYTRHGAEREYRVLRWINYSSGVGELVE